MFRLFTAIIFLILTTSLLNAEVVNSIQISGNKRVSNETIKIYGGIDVNKDLSETDLNKVLTNLYSTNFFEDVKISLSQGILKIDLIEFPIINQLIIIGEPTKKYVEEIKKLFSQNKKTHLFKITLLKMLRELNHYIQVLVSIL